MKKTNTSNPLKFFNDNKAMAYKKTGSQMSKYKVKLKKAQDGINVGPVAARPSYWFDDLNKKAAADAKFRQSAARIRDNNNDPDAEKDYGRLANSYSPNGPNLDLPVEMNTLNQKYPYYEGFSEETFIGGDNNKGWDKVREMKPAKDKRYKEVSSNFEYMGEPKWKKKGGSVKTKNK